MSRKTFEVRLKQIHKQHGKSVPDVADALGMSHNTVGRYVNKDFVTVRRLDTTVVLLARYYGVDWKDVVSVVEEITESPESKNPIAEAA